jgi:predicted transcriptional regulator
VSKPAVLISIRPVWCGKIFGGFKNLEFRKSKPYFPPPFKCYVYCTQKRERLLEIIKDGDMVYNDVYHGKPIFIKSDAHGNDTAAWINGWCKKVIGEFTVDRIEEVTVDYSGETPVAFYGAERFLDLPPGYIKSGGLTLEEFEKYKGKGKVYGWHIADYTIYPGTKEVGDFSYHACIDRVKAAPQSFCYVNELE